CERSDREGLTAAVAESTMEPPPTRSCLMLRLLAAIVVLAVASPALADEKDNPKPNALTPKEIAEGWVLLFDGETTFGWAPFEYEKGKEPDLAVKDGRLIVSGPGRAARYTTRVGYFELAGEYRAAGKGNGLIFGFRRG